MIAIPERITKNSDAETEENISAMQDYLDYLTERVNVAILELSDEVREMETRVRTLESRVTQGGNNNG